MDPYEIIITPDAETDLLELRDYIADTLLVPHPLYILVVCDDSEQNGNNGENVGEACTRV